MTETVRKGKRFGLIGRRLGHSWSQRWFEDLFAKEHLEDYSYRLYELPTMEGLREWVRQKGLSGFNVTVPYKQAVISNLDTLDPVAATIGAVNCVTVEKGRLIGHNTDAQAFQQTLERIENLELRNEKIAQAIIMGTGGAARAVAYALDQLNIPYTFVSRNPEKWLAAGSRWSVIGYDQFSSLTSHLSPFTLIVNATPVGMYPDIDQTPLPLTPSHSLSLPFTSSLVYDLIYNPSPTLLLRQAAALGAHTKDGLEMLHLQAQLSWELFKKIRIFAVSIS